MEMANKTRPGTHPWEAPLSQPSELCPSSALSPPHCPLIYPYVDAVADGAQRRAEVTAPHPPLPQPPAGHGIADGSRLVQCDFPLVAGCNPCWLLLITFFSPSCLGMASRMSCSISRGGDEADRPGGARTLAALFGDRADTGSPPACRDLSHSPGTLQDDSSSAVTSAAPSALVVCPAGTRGFVCTDFAWTISSMTLVPFPSPPFPTLFPCSGISEGQKTKLERELCLGKQSSGKKRHSWVLLAGFVLGKKCRVVFRALLVTPGNDTGKAAGPKGGTAQGLHEPELPWTSAVCSGQGLEGFGTALSF